MSFSKRPLHSPETNLPECKIQHLNSSSSNSFVSATSNSESFFSNKTLTPNMSRNEDFDFATSPDFVDLICTMIFEVNNQPLLSPSLTDDDAFFMLRQVE